MLREIGVVAQPDLGAWRGRDRAADRSGYAGALACAIKKTCYVMMPFEDLAWRTAPAGVETNTYTLTESQLYSIICIVY